MFKDLKRSAGTDTLIGQGTRVEGKMVCEANLRIEGEYRGDIECAGSVIIGEAGIARSNITATDLIVAGRIIGDVAAKGRLTITSNGQLHGNVTAGSFILHDGGILNGHCRMEFPQETHTRPLAETESAASPIAPPVTPAAAGTAASSSKELSGSALSAAKEAAREKARQAG
ncbi:bactofilin family protein [Paenibacillus protaetiae]|uniref:Polymer-forming cytoskeletal protein n=1 Tax=Paenibacillus protaetiae TaxID=2509456 RepID=A0A4P6F1Y1_9BACL|nr:polymer-forming cytoskeletal protein [Paenibacillus protaetiae]QAY68149.1 polymer-forming cytoskeletal protein [Paenibacillus protaetiae]